MEVFRKVLLADPVMVSHSLLYYSAALASKGFEQTQFSIATATQTEKDRERALTFAEAHPNIRLRLLDIDPGSCAGRIKCWRGFARSMRAIEKLLQTESFDLIAYLALDPLLLFFALPGFPRRFPGHTRAMVAGTLFRDNGLREPIEKSLKARGRAWTDIAILRRALRNPALRKIAFLDHWCTDRGRQKFGSDKIGYGIDPVFVEACDEAAARKSLGLAPDDFAVLLFGMLSDRKGIIETLQMLRQASLPTEKTVIIVAGPATPDIQAPLDEELRQTREIYRVIRANRFLQQSEVPPYFAAADCAVCIYKDFSGSSSVLLHSAIYGKPVIVSPGGAMEDAVRRYKFGEVVSINDRKGFCTAIEKLAALSPEARAALGQHAKKYGRLMDAGNYMQQFL